ncbi:MAG: radical SAM protein, partial [Planctomycetaceae bacterium]|nr:radical SAM protein [Planctomycetaceae bacterium]
MSKTPDVKGTFSFVSLGCPKNLVDSERMLGLLAADGYVLVPDAEKADLVIINTCGFIDAARQESLGVIREMLDRKRAGEIKGVVVAGCLAERQKEELLEEVPEVDQVVGVFGREEIARVADRIMGDLHEQRTVFRPAPVRAQEDRARLRITPRHLAYLKVSEGCDRLCTFCAIPAMRGKHVTKPIEQVIDEARELAADGVRELNLVAQDMTYYGVDLYGRPRLADLLRELDQVEGIDWIRV